MRYDEGPTARAEVLIDAPLAITAMPEKEERIVARRLEEFEANMRATLDGIKQLAEHGA